MRRRGVRFCFADWISRERMYSVSEQFGSRGAPTYIGTRTRGGTTRRWRYTSARSRCGRRYSIRPIPVRSVCLSSRKAFRARRSTLVQAAWVYGCMLHACMVHGCMLYGAWLYVACCMVACCMVYVACLHVVWLYVACRWLHVMQSSFPHARTQVPAGRALQPAETTMPCAARPTRSATRAAG